MRCSTAKGTDVERDCLGTATHMVVGSIRDEDGREPFRDPVCEPCGRAYERRPALRARIVPLHIYRPVPPIEIWGGHRLIEHGKGNEQCFDCQKIGPRRVFTVGRNGCPARPESVSLTIQQHEGRFGDKPARAKASAEVFRAYITRIGLWIEDWRPVTDHPTYCAYFTFREREYGLKYDLAAHRMAAEKLDNRGRPEPELLDVQYGDNPEQVVFRFHNMVNKYESSYFATYTPGREDVILHAPEGQIVAVLRLTGFNRPGNPLDEVTDAVCDAFGAIESLQFKDWIYE